MNNNDIFDYCSVAIDDYCINNDFDSYDLYGERMEDEEEYQGDIDFGFK